MSHQDTLPTEQEFKASFKKTEEVLEHLKIIQESFKITITRLEKIEKANVA